LSLFCYICIYSNAITFYFKGIRFFYPYFATLKTIMAGKRPKKLSSKEKRKKDIRLIVQSNELVEARYMFDTWEMRFFHFFASMIRKNDVEDKKYRIWLKDVKKAYKLNNNDSYHQLRSAAKRLSDKSVFLNYEQEGVVRELKHRFIKYVDYIQDGQKIIGSQEYVDVSIDREMLPFLLLVQKNFDPEKTRYTAYDFRNVIELKPYSARIYQWLKKEEYRKERILTVDEIKRQFNIIDEYKRFSTLYQRIIEPSLVSINEHTDITIPLDKIEKLKKGRKIYAIRVPIYSKTNKEIAYLQGESIQGTLFDVQEVDKMDAVPEPTLTKVDVLYTTFEQSVVKDFGVTPSVFLKMLLSGVYTKAAIEQAIEVTRRAKFKQEISKSVAGFFVSALKAGFTDEKIERKKKALAKKKDHTKQLEQIEIEYANKKTERIKTILEQEVGAKEKVLAYLKNSTNKQLAARISALNLSVETISIEDFRADKILRGFFIQGILHEYQEYFTDINRAYQQKLRKNK